MNWYQNLYLGKNAEKRKDSLIEKLDVGQTNFPVYLITLAPEEANQLEILTAPNYWRQAARKGTPMVVGLALGMREAREVVRRMVEDTYRATGGADVRAYLTEQAARMEEESCQERKKPSVPPSREDHLDQSHR